MRSLTLNLALGAAALANASSSKPGYTIWPTPPEPVLPTKDDFYISPPKNLASYSPGDLIRVRVAPGNLTSLYNASTAHHLLYRTSYPSPDCSNTSIPTYALTTLLSPLANSTTASSSTTLLSYQIAYNTASLDGAASYTLNSAAGVPTLADLTSALSRGWYVATPDHESVHSAFLEGRLEGRAVIDGVRAVLQFSESGGEKEEKGIMGIGLDAEEATWGMWGYSGGSVASGFAGEEVRRGYAADLEGRLVGMALGGMPVGVGQILANVDATPYAGLIPEGLLGITTLHPENRGRLVESLKGGEKREEFMKALEMGIAEAVPNFAGQEMGDYFTDGFEAIQAEYLVDLFEERSELGKNNGGETVATPIFAYKSVHDEFSGVGFSDDLIGKYCATGANVRYDRNTVDGGHLSEYQDGHSRALAFLAARFAGEPFQEGCVVRNVSVVDPTGGYLGEDW